MQAILWANWRKGDWRRAMGFRLPASGFMPWGGLLEKTVLGTGAAAATYRIYGIDPRG